MAVVAVMEEAKRNCGGAKYYCGGRGGKLKLWRFTRAHQGTALLCENDCQVLQTKLLFIVRF